MTLLLRWRWGPTDPVRLVRRARRCWRCGRSSRLSLCVGRRPTCVFDGRQCMTLLPSVGLPISLAIAMRFCWWREFLRHQQSLQPWICWIVFNALNTAMDGTDPSVGGLVRWIWISCSGGNYGWITLVLFCHTLGFTCGRSWWNLSCKFWWSNVARVIQAIDNQTNDSGCYF